MKTCRVCGKPTQGVRCRACTKRKDRYCRECGVKCTGHRCMACFSKKKHSKVYKMRKYRRTVTTFINKRI